VERLDAVLAALAESPPDRGHLAAALALVPRLREELDSIERALIDTARESGASWTDIASALGLRSRQAAEQRRLRLGASQAPRDPEQLREFRKRQQIVDERAGEHVVELRRAVRDLALAVDRIPDRERLGPLVVLARQTLEFALVADPGGLVDLSRLIAADLQGIPDLEKGVERLTRGGADRKT